MMKLPQILQRVAHEFPDRPGITFEGRTRTWKEVLQRCEQLAGGLKKLGLNAGDRSCVRQFRL